MAKRLASERQDATRSPIEHRSLGDYEGILRRSDDQTPVDVARSGVAFRILAVLDGTRESSRLLDYVIELKARVGNIEVVLIHCYQPAFLQQIGRLAGGHRNMLREMTKRSRRLPAVGWRRRRSSRVIA